MIKESGGAVTLAVHVVPGARRNEIVGMEGATIKIRLRATPVEEKANDALIEFLAEALKVSRAQIEIVSGQASRRKIVRMRGVNAMQVQSIAKAK